MEIHPAAMYEDFTATDPLTQQAIHCEYQCLVVGIATRHSDTVDIKFLVNGQGVWLGLPHPAWVEFKRIAGVPLSDRMAVDLAGSYLKRAIETGLGADRNHWNDISVADVLSLAAGLNWIPQTAVPQ
ncbi:MAG TPA: hypothetical protein VMV31_00400 [Terriglobales bacterium]|nr:hypothetical protein [Terriglobales bacterium]